MHIFRIKRRDEFVLGKGFYIVDKNGSGASAIDLIEEAGRAINSVEELRDDYPYKYSDFPNIERERVTGWGVYDYARRWLSPAASDLPSTKIPYADRNVHNYARRWLSSEARSEARAWVAVMKGLFKLAIEEMEACYVKFDEIGGFSVAQGDKRRYLLGEKHVDAEKRRAKMLRELDEGVVRALVWAEDICYDQYVEKTKRWKLPIQNKQFRMKVAATAVSEFLLNTKRSTYARALEKRSKNLTTVVQIAGRLPAFGSGKPVEYSATSNWKAPVV